MGGRVWSEPEERIFWRLAKKFPTGMDLETKAAKKNHRDIHEEWHPFIQLMINEWHSQFPGTEPRRNYTAISLYEHYFQNYIISLASPNAGPYLSQYHAWVKEQARNAKGTSETQHAGLGESSESAAASSQPMAQDSVLPTSILQNAVRLRDRGQKARPRRLLPRLARTSAGGPSQALDRPRHAQRPADVDAQPPRDADLQFSDDDLSSAKVAEDLENMKRAWAEMNSRYAKRLRMMDAA